MFLLRFSEEPSKKNIPTETYYRKIRITPSKAKGTGKSITHMEALLLYRRKSLGTVPSDNHLTLYNH